MLPEALDHCPGVKEIPQTLSTREMPLQLKLLIKTGKSLSTLSLFGSPREASKAGAFHVFVHLPSFTPLHLQVD